MWSWGDLRRWALVVGIVAAAVLLLLSGVASAQQTDVVADRAAFGTTNTSTSSPLVLGTLPARSSGQGVMSRDSNGLVRSGALVYADLPSTLTQRNVAEAISSLWAFNAGIEVGGNATITGTGRRILADYSSATIANRAAFQSSVTNGATWVSSLPNGSSTVAGFTAANAATPTNAGVVSLVAGASGHELRADRHGSGAYLPFSIWTSAAERFRVGTGGDLWMGAGVPSFMPVTNYGPDLGGPSNKLRSIWGGELFLETIVAQQRITTMGGRLTVTPSNILTRDIGTGTGANIPICVKYNSFLLYVAGVEWGSKILMEKNGQFEWFLITSTSTPTVDPVFGDYCYTANRNADGSGQNAWTAGDGIIDTGKIGSGSIDLYAIRGLTSATLAGPSIDFLQRTGDVWSALAVRATVGNLRGKWGYASDVFGMASGNASATWIAMDPVNGFRVMFGASPRFTADASGNVSLTGNVSSATWQLSNTAGLLFAAGSTSTADAPRAVTWTNGAYLYSYSSGADDVFVRSGEYLRDTATVDWQARGGTSSVFATGIRLAPDVIELLVPGSGTAVMRPSVDSAIDIGSSSFRIRNIYLNLGPTPTATANAAVVLDPANPSRLHYVSGLSFTVRTRNVYNTGECFITFVGGIATATNCTY